MTHEMRLKDEPFLAIKRGRKTVELRLFDEKRSQIKDGDFIEFTNTLTGELMLCKVAKIRIFPDFATLYAAYDKIAIGYEENQAANPEDMLAYYGQDEIARYGVVAIEIQFKK